MSRNFLTVIGAVSLLLVTFGRAGFLEAQAPLAGHGVYRPFNLFRQFKLGASYFVDPSLPDKAEVFDAYRLTDVIGDSDDIPADLQSELDSGALQVGVQLPDRHSFILTIPCGPDESEEMPGSTVNWSCPNSYGFLSQWLQHYSQTELQNLYVLHPREEQVWTPWENPWSADGRPVITWEPQEPVADLFLADNPSVAPSAPAGN